MDIFNQYAGAEELGLDEGAASVAEAAGDAAEAAVSAEIGEVTAALEEQTAEIEKLVDKVDDLEDAVEEVEEAVEGMESMLNSGNFHSVSFANMYNRALKLAEKLPAPEGQIMLGDRVGAENMTDAATAQLFARAGVESFVERVKEYGKKAVEFIKHIFNQVINFFVSLFNKADGLTRREAQLRKRLNDGAKIRDKVKMGGWNVYIDYATDGLSKGSKKDKGNFDKTTKAVADLVKAAQKGSSMTVADIKSKHAAVVTAIKADAKEFGKYNEKKNGSKDVILSQAAGIRAMANFSEPTINNFAEAAAAIRSIKLQMVKAPEAKKMSTGEVKAKADKAALVTVLDGVKGTIAEIRSDETAKLMTASARDQLVGTLNNMKAGNSDKSAEIDGQVNVVKAACSLAAQVASNTNKQRINSAGAHLDAVAAHLSFGSN